MLLLKGGRTMHFNAVRTFVEEQARNIEQSPFTFYAAQVALERLEQASEEQDYHGMVLWRPGDRSAGRMVEKAEEQFYAEDRRLASRLIPDEGSYVESQYQRVSRDAIASFDQSLMPQSFALVDKTLDERATNAPPSSPVVSLEAYLTSDRAHQAYYFPRVIQFVDAQLVPHLKDDPWLGWWRSQKPVPSDPEFVHKLREKIAQIKQASQYQELHFDLFENFEGDEKLMPRGVKSGEGVDAAVLLQEIHRPAVRVLIERDMGISLRDLSLREQIQLLSYLASVDYQTAQKGFSVIREFGIDGARSFLSCEYRWRG